MQDRPITELMRPVRILIPDDPISRAASLMRASGLSELPVVNYGRVAGMVHEKDLVAKLSEEDGSNTPVAQVMKSEPVLANKYMSLQQIADTFTQYEVAVLPVVDEYGAYQGLLARADVVAVLGKVLRPQTVGGMATPLGVHLTSGTISAGPGSLGLFLSGVVMCICMALASAIAYGIEILIGSVTGLPMSALLESTPLSSFNLLDAPSYVHVGLTFLFFLILLKLSPLAGYHAAEHMVVHTMEQGEQITPDVVKQMPRIHPRCGTNLLVAVALFSFITAKFSSFEAVIVTLVILVLGWRTVGGYVQYYFSTKTPNEKQVANGVKVGNELMEKYQENPNLQISNLQRIWNIGLLQTAAGLAVTYFIMGALLEALHLSSVILP